MTSVKWCPGHNDLIHREGLLRPHPSVRDFVQLRCAGGWEVIKLKEKEMQVNNYTLSL